MPVKLSVVNEEEDGAPSDYLFEDERVTIGRSDENHLTLSDPKRIVSAEHAMVKRTDAGYRLVDRGSKNFTYLGNQRVTSQKPRLLSDGDVFRIGDFRIRFRTVDRRAAARGEGGETMFEDDFQNPFAEPVRRLVEALRTLDEAYADTAPQRRNDALEEAVDRVGEVAGEEGGVRHVLSVLGLSEAGTASPAASPEASPSQQSASSRGTAASTRSAVPSGSVDGEVVEVLTDAVAKVVRIPWRFRHEFIGQTVVQAPETRFLYSGSGEAIREHLLDASLTDKERRDRLGYVEEAAEALAVHQVAMLNGYKASVVNGAETLLDRLDPVAHRDAVIEETPLLEYAPVLASPTTLDRLRGEWDELRQGEGAAAEKRVFRPAFTKAYLARMTAPRGGDEDAPSHP